MNAMQNERPMPQEPIPDQDVPAPEPVPDDADIFVPSIQIPPNGSSS